MRKKPFSAPVDLHEPRAALAEVRSLLRLMSPRLDLAPVETAYGDMLRLFAGRYPGYRACNTRYHDVRHTIDTLVAMTRLMHGASVRGARFTGRELALSSIAAVFHDSGYIQTADDTEGTGAKYTTCHVDRSVLFLDQYFAARGFPADCPGIAATLLRCTGLNVDVSAIRFASARFKLLGRMLGAGDLLGQMADRAYLKKLLFLFAEFKEGKVPGFGDEFDLLEKTIGFYEVTKQRLARDLGGVDRYMRAHFKARWGLDRDPYAEAIRRHIDCLMVLIAEHRDDYRRFLRAGSL